jgi:hypothetical protein
LNPRPLECTLLPFTGDYTFAGLQKFYQIEWNAEILGVSRIALNMPRVIFYRYKAKAGH